MSNSLLKIQQYLDRRFFKILVKKVKIRHQLKYFMDKTCLIDEPNKYKIIKIVQNKYGFCPYDALEGMMG